MSLVKDLTLSIDAFRREMSKTVTFVVEISYIISQISFYCQGLLYFSKIKLENSDTRNEEFCNL